MISSAPLKGRIIADAETAGKRQSKPQALAKYRDLLLFALLKTAVNFNRSWIRLVCESVEFRTSNLSP